jgi:hypothetical protein
LRSRQTRRPRSASSPSSRLCSATRRRSASPTTSRQRSCSPTTSAESAEVGSNAIAERLKLRVATRAQAKLELVIVDNGARMHVHVRRLTSLTCTCLTSYTSHTSGVHVRRLTSHVSRLTSRVTRDTSHVSRHASHVATRAQAKLELVIVDNGARMTHSMTHIFTERAKRIQSVEWGRKARECVSSVFFLKFQGLRKFREIWAHILIYPPKLKKKIGRFFLKLSS